MRTHVHVRDVLVFVAVFFEGRGKRERERERARIGLSRSYSARSRTLARPYWSYPPTWEMPAGLINSRDLWSTSGWFTATSLSRIYTTAADRFMEDGAAVVPLSLSFSPSRPSVPPSPPPSLPAFVFLSRTLVSLYPHSLSLTLSLSFLSISRRVHRCTSPSSGITSTLVHLPSFLLLSLSLSRPPTRDFLLASRLDLGCP